MKKLIVTAIAPVKADGKEQNFKTITLTQQSYVYDEEGEKVNNANPRSYKHISYEKTYANGVAGAGPMDALYNTTLGEKWEGDIVVVPTEPFMIDEYKAGQRTGQQVERTTDNFIVFSTNTSNDDLFKEEVEKVRVNRSNQRLKKALSVATAATPTI